MKAEVFVLEADAAGLAVGQKATLSHRSASPDVAFTGKVTQVDKLARPRIPRRAGAVLRRDRRRSTRPIRA